MPGVRVGHWTDAEARTGCTVALFPEGTVASGEVRGGAPATREFALLAPHRLVAHLDAVVLTGGSAFGLAAADGVMRFCEERGMGFPTPAGPVPIVVSLGLYDLGVGDPSVRPGPEEGYAASTASVDHRPALGPVGAGAGATVAKWRGPDHVRPGGLGGAVYRDGEVVVAALVAVNAVGEAHGPGPVEPRVPTVTPFDASLSFDSTTIGVVATNARLDKVGCYLSAISGHDGLARALSPVHTQADGDGLVVAATCAVEGRVERVRELAAAAVEEAVRQGAAEGADGQSGK